MDRHTSTEQGQQVPGTGGIGPNAVLRFVVFVFVVPGLLFLAAGTVNWPTAWAYLAINIAFTFGSRFVVLRRNPELLAERARYMEGEGAKSWDKTLVPLVAQWGSMLMLIVAGLNRRFGWQPAIPVEIQVVALVVLVLGSAFATWAMAVNRFFSAVVRIQKDRGHTVVTAGPYQFVRHPGYAGGIVAQFATPLALGAPWALIPAVLTAGLTVLRTALEDRTLQEELDGYKEYAQRVRYRLLPGIW
jgi:protein-S-isoprenylcysteine O-methyltransferase Ste14